MIRINLLPVQSDRKRQYGKQQLALGLVLLAAEVGALFFWYSNMQTELQEQTQRTDEVQREVTELEAQNRQIQELNGHKEQLQNVGRVLAELEANRAGPVHVLDEIKAMLNPPANDLQRVNQQYLGWDTNVDPTNVWLSRFEEEGGAVTISGRAMSNNDIAEFNVRLANSPYFSNVRLTATRAENDPQLGRVYSFGLTARVNYGASANAAAGSGN